MVGFEHYEDPPEDADRVEVEIRLNSVSIHDEDDADLNAQALLDAAETVEGDR